MKIKHYLFTALIAYIALIIYMAPANPILYLLTKDNNNIVTSSVTGSVWSGDARSIRINRHEITDIHWSFTPWRLLTAETCFEINGLYHNQDISSSLCLTLLGDQLARDFTSTMSAYTVGKRFDIPVGELDGDLIINIEKASWAAGTVPKVSGEILWQKAAYIVAEKAELGDLTIIFDENDSSPLTATISNTGGHLSVNGNIDVDNEGRYELGISLKPTNTASQNLRNSLKLVAKPKPGGNFEINNAGELSTLGLM